MSGDQERRERQRLARRAQQAREKREQERLLHYFSLGEVAVARLTPIDKRLIAQGLIVAEPLSTVQRRPGMRAIDLQDGILLRFITQRAGGAQPPPPKARAIQV